MSDAQAMKKKMDIAQKEVEALSVQGSAQGQSVFVTLSGTGALESIHIEPSLLSSFPEMVGDLVILAHKEAFQEIQKRKEEIMSKVQGGLSLPF